VYALEDFQRFATCLDAEKMKKDEILFQETCLYNKNSLPKTTVEELSGI